MDVEPIYCAEQIVVPVDLADILKAYTKEVIRRQPEDLIEFSARYFANLSSLSGAASEAAAPERDQLRLVLGRAGGQKTLTVHQVGALCSQAGISQSIVGKVLDAGHFDKDAVSVDKFLFLLLAMTCESFAAVVDGIFELFGRELDTERFVALISYLAPDMDPDVTTQFISDLNSALLDVPMVKREDAVRVPVMAAKLAQK